MRGRLSICFALTAIGRQFFASQRQPVGTVTNKLLTLKKNYFFAPPASTSARAEFDLRVVSPILSSL
jgi:hypothetical protein